MIVELGFIIQPRMPEQIVMVQKVNVGTQGVSGSADPLRPNKAADQGEITQTDTGISVTGAGTSATPYIVASTTTANAGLTPTTENIQLNGNLIAATSVTNNAQSLTIASGGSNVAYNRFAVNRNIN